MKPHKEIVCCLFMQFSMTNPTFESFKWQTCSDSSLMTTWSPCFPFPKFEKHRYIAFHPSCSNGILAEFNNWLLTTPLQFRKYPPWPCSKKDSSQSESLLFLLLSWTDIIPKEKMTGEIDANQDALSISGTHAGNEIDIDGLPLWGILPFCWAPHCCIYDTCYQEKYRILLFRAILFERERSEEYQRLKIDPVLQKKSQRILHLALKYT